MVVEEVLSQRSKIRIVGSLVVVDSGVVEQFIELVKLHFHVTTEADCNISTDHGGTSTNQWHKR